MAALFCGAYIAHLFSLLRKRAHYHSLGGPPGPLSPSGFAPNALLLRNASYRCLFLKSA